MITQVITVNGAMHLVGTGMDSETAYDTEDFTVHHNGDYSGDVWITVEGSRLEDLGEVEPGVHHHIVKIPFDVMKELVANWARANIISDYEQMSADEIFDRL
jgi:hypothetical protein